MNDLSAAADPWAFLQSYTSARIAQGRTGHSLPTRALLDFQLDHARARDAVYSGLATETLINTLEELHPPVLTLHSQAADRRQYLQRPDLGRRLDNRSRETLTALASAPTDLCLVVADGLSATAINSHVVPVVSQLLSAAGALDWTIAPLCVVEQARVAIADEIGYLLHAEMMVILIGERPGLSSCDSMGAYLTYQPRTGLTDESRNCISNIRPEGLPYDAAVQKLMYLLGEMKTRRLSGVHLKDEMSGFIG